MIRLRTAAIGSAAILACTAEPAAPAGTTGAESTTMSAASTGGTLPGTSGVADTTGSSVGTSTSGTDPSDDSSGDDGPPVDLPPLPARVPCGLTDVDPAADPTMVIEAGDGAEQIPTVIGDVLLRNCGCHYNVNPLMPGIYIDYISNKQPMAVWSDFHGNFKGTFPQGYAEMPAYLAIEQRVVFHHPLPMPPLRCAVEDEDGTITVADLATLTDWLAAGAPDGANYPPG